MQIIAVDCESTGLRPRDFAVEVAWYNLDTHERGVFIPPHHCDFVVKFGQPEALEVNKYKERIYGAPQDDGTEGKRFRTAVEGNLLIGSNVRGDARWISDMFLNVYGIRDDEEPWHYHLLEVSSFAIPILGRKLKEPPSQSKLCEILGVEEGDHTAWGDVLALVQIIQKLEDMRS